jgi:dTDP-4-amino-4,6-dideoxygalactose transaminase
MDVNRLRSYLERGVRVKAVAPVHLYGQMVDMDPILQLAENYNFLVIEDACQAHGARYYSKRRNRWLRAGSMGDAAAFSFYPGKNLGACGEGGAITTNNPEVARRAAMLRDHGQASKYYHDIEGYNGRLDAIQCSFLRIKLRTLDEANEKRRNAASVYAELLTGVSEIALPYEPDWAKSVYHLYVVRTSERDALQKHLQKRNIGTGLHYPLPLHLQKCYAGRNWSDDLSATNAASSTILSLPMYPGIQREQQKYVADCIREFFQESHPDMRRPIGIEMIR